MKVSKTEKSALTINNFSALYQIETSAKEKAETFWATNNYSQNLSNKMTLYLLEMYTAIGEQRDIQ